MNAQAALGFNAALLLADIVDELGTVKAEIATMQAKEKALVAKLTATGLTEIDGSLFRATVSTCDRTTVKTKELRADMGDDVLKDYLSTSSVTTVRVNARKTS